MNVKLERCPIFGHIATVSTLLLLFVQISITYNVETKLNEIDKDVEQLKSLNSLHSEANHHHRYKRNILSSPTSTLNNTNALPIIENEITQLRKDLTGLNESSSLSSKDKLKITEMENITGELKKSLIILKQNLDKKDSTNNKTLANMNQLWSTVLLSSMAHNIHSGRFKLAEQLLRMKDDVNYDNFVEIVYNCNVSNIDSIIRFGEYISDANQKFKIFKSLFNQMKTNAHRDIWMLVRQMQSLKNILRLTANATEVQSLYNSVYNEVRVVATGMIAHDFLTNDSLSTTKSLKNILTQYFSQSMCDIYNEVIDSVFNTFSIPTIIDIAKKINHLESEMAVHQAIFNKLKSEWELNSNPSISLARAIKSVMNHSNYEHTPLCWKTLYENIKTELPESIKNLVFSSEICIKNSYYEEYLFASHIEHGCYAINDQKRSVYTWIPQIRKDSSTFKWRVKFTGDYQIELENVEFDEKLTACNDTYCCYYGHDSCRRMVFTSCQINSTSIKESQYQWHLEVVREGLQMRNVAMKEYLMADYDRQRDKQRRYVFTFTSGKRTMDSKWEIINCSNSLGSF